jgi:exodeoxyribonuclease V beta subunit
VQHVEVHYALQAKLYSLALVKALEIRSEPAYEQRFGGLVYVFLRGLKGSSSERPAVYFCRPTWAEILKYEEDLKHFASRAPGGRS